MARRKSALRTVDPLAGLSADAAIYEDANGVVWHFMLNMTDIAYGSYGHNKYYMMQVIEERGKFFCFRRWGRVGAKTPQRNLERHGDSLEKAQASFQKKFVDKSGNEWPLGKRKFRQVKGKYLLVELDDDEPEEDEEDDQDDDSAPQDVPASTLDAQIQDVLQLINDADLIQQEMAAMKLDLQRLPLGRLSKKQISHGYDLLQQLSSVTGEIASLTKADDDEATSSTPEAGPSETRGRRRSTRPKRRVASARVSRIRHLKGKLQQLSSEFYSIIPHDFGRNLPPPIDSIEEVRLKIDLLEVLADLEISQKLRSAKNKGENKAKNPLDVHYDLLNAEMAPLPSNDKEFDVIRRYVETTHAPTHVQYKLGIRSILRLHRRDEDALAQDFAAISNHRLLWHGSRLCNVVGILAKGLRVAPAEAPSNGYMFGKGMYFADSVSKSANYCWATPAQPRGILLLAEVALGTTHNVVEAEEDLDYTKLRETYKCDSVHGQGKFAANPESYETLQSGAVVPIGEFEPTDVTESELLYNEFVVFRQEQVRLRYVVAVDFQYEQDM